MGKSWEKQENNWKIMGDLNGDFHGMFIRCEWDFHGDQAGENGDIKS